MQMSCKGFFRNIEDSVKNNKTRGRSTLLPDFITLNTGLRSIHAHPFRHGIHLRFCHCSPCEYPTLIRYNFINLFHYCHKSPLSDFLPSPTYNCHTNVHSPYAQEQYNPDALPE